jgi:hypothetical protein
MARDPAATRPAKIPQVGEPAPFLSLIHTDAADE